MATDWEDVLLAYLHDPPGKALGIQQHENRSAALASLVLNRKVDQSALHRDTRTEDQLASMLERVIPLPTAGSQGERAVGPVQGRLQVIHPLAGTAEMLDVSFLQQDPNAERDTLRELLQGLDPPRARAFAVWRLWRNRLAMRHPSWGDLPADTRLPDHTIWNHVDTAAGLRPSLGQHGVCLLAFSLGPVQTFIATAKTLRDLWTGSYLLSWLTFAAMTPVLEELGLAAVISPCLRGNPLADRWLRQMPFPESPGAPQLLKGLVHEPDLVRLLSPCLPNRFLAFVPSGKDLESARGFARRCEKAGREAWGEVCAAVRRALDGLIQGKKVPHAAGWDRLWEEQVGSFFEMRAAVLPLNDCTEERLEQLLVAPGQPASFLANAADVRSLDHVLRQRGHAYGFAQQSAGQWTGQLSVLSGLVEATRSVRHVPMYVPRPDANGMWPGKCGLMGSYEQMGPAERHDAAAFWEALAGLSMEGTRVRPRERLCAVSLVKRFAWPAYFTQRLDSDPRDLRYPDTATVAAALWLAESPAMDPDEVRRTFCDWSGQWLHATPRGTDEDRPPPAIEDQIRQKRARHKDPVPTYYAVLMLDGDGLGKWLRGDNAPLVKDVLHPTIANYYRGPGGTAPKGLTARRPVGPALHAALSEALTNYALHFVPEVVAKHHGTLIYAGGDDVLALLPTRTALSCARALEEVYRRPWDTDAKGRRRLLMGSRATVSAGLAVLHYKEDLRIALEAARAAEKQAKNAGRNALTVRICRRSGEDSSATLDWGLVAQLETLVTTFVEGVSDRWAYRLRAELPTLGSPNLPWEAISAEIRRLLGRVEETDTVLREEFLRIVLQFLDGYKESWSRQERRGSCAEAEVQQRTLEGFVTLCQSASFLARGRDHR